MPNRHRGQDRMIGIEPEGFDLTMKIPIIL